MKAQFLSVLVLCSVVVATLAAQNPMRPGSWEVTTQIEMAAMPVKMPPIKATQCVTPAQLKDPASALPSAAPNCKVSDYKTSGNTVSWKMACSAPQNMTGSGEMTFVGDTYNGTIKANTTQGEMTIKTSGKRLGDCTTP